MLGSPLLGGASAAGGSTGDRIDITTERLQLVFSPAVPVPLVWRACHPSCAAADIGAGTSIRFAVAARAHVTLPSAARDVGLSQAAVAAAVTDTPTARVVTFTSEAIDGVRLVTAFEIARRGYDVIVAARVVGPNANAFMAGRRLTVELEARPTWAPTPTAGWLPIDNDVRRLVLGETRVRLLGDNARGPTPFHARQWIGFRDRFWTLLAHGGDGATVDLPTDASLAVVLESAPGASSARYTVYAGPLEYRALSDVDPELRGLLFSGLWSWLRVLSLGALLLLHALIAVVGHPGPAIILLAVAVKLLLLPVTTIAHHLQTQVEQTQGRLQPEIDAIKAGYGGEVQARRLLELYRRQGVHPLYTLKSLVGVLIQLPVFIAVFDMLAENFALNGASFLGIADLAQPDGLILLPVAIPGLGSRLNLLAFVMYGVSLASALRYEAAALTPTLLRRQRQKLAALTALFLVLFYAFPAGMVLYWTSTNALQLAVREISRRWRGRIKPAPPIPAPHVSE
jgi:YidC/Oxa1 family membrane protein insertase